MSLFSFDVLPWLYKLQIISWWFAGYYISPGNPDAGPALTGWRILRWESGTKPVNIHPLLESTTGTPPTITTWTSVAKQNITRGRFSKASQPSQQKQRPVNPRSVARVIFAAHGGELAVALFTGEVHIFSGAYLLGPIAR